MDIRRRELLKNSKGEDEEVTYELDAPKLIVDYTVETAAKNYIFNSTDYPELEKCKCLNIIATGTNVDTVVGYIWCIINNNSIGECGNTSVPWNFYVGQRDGLFYCEGRSGSVYTIHNSTPIVQVTSGAEVNPKSFKFAPIKKIELKSPLNNICAAGTRIRIYGFY